jgi:hypothetical protein
MNIILVQKNGQQFPVKEIIVQKWKTLITIGNEEYNSVDLSIDYFLIDNVKFSFEEILASQYFRDYEDLRFKQAETFIGTKIDAGRSFKIIEATFKPGRCEFVLEGDSNLYTTPIKEIIQNESYLVEFISGSGKHYTLFR